MGQNWHLCRAAAPEKDCESRIEISGKTSYCYNFASLLILFFSIILYIGQLAGEHFEEKEEESSATTDTTFPASGSRAEIAPEDQDSAELRVGFAPAKR